MKAEKEELKPCKCGETKIDARGNCIKFGCGIFRTSTPHLFVNCIEVEYENPWHNPRERSSRPTFKTTVFGSEADSPVARGDCLIYPRIRSTEPGGDVWDVVLDGLCVSQCAGLNGAKAAVDERRWEDRNWWKKRQ